MSPVKQLPRIILWLSLFALITGTLLVHPKNFTFHTPWIKAAYLLLIAFSLGILMLKKYIINPYLLRFSYFILLIILIFITHDAVTKTTFLPL
jgi:uncharacterized membrane protein YozB (DUF420 family)